METNRELTKIELAFENVTVAEIEAKDIKWIEIKGVNKSYKYRNEYYNRFDEYIDCQSVYIRISKDVANKKIENYGYVERLFKKIRRRPNIVSITLYYNDNTEEDIQVPWKSVDREDEENKYQIAYIDYGRWKGDLVIQIASDQSVFK